MAQPAPNCKGTTFEIKKAGNGGKAIAKGSNATVHATGVVLETGKKFWSTKDPGQQPFSYQAGVGGVIKGWDLAIMDMREGEARRLVIPAALGYGDRGAGGKIPGGATLYFEVELAELGGPPQLSDAQEAWLAKNPI